MIKLCEYCGIEFETKPHTRLTIIKSCSPKCRTRLYSKNNPLKKLSHYIKRKESGRLKDRVRNYGISVDEYNKLYEIQNGLCAICKNPEKSKSTSGSVKMLAIDHCHFKNKVRGLLCQKCNIMIGHANDNIELLQSAINYLKINEK